MELPNHRGLEEKLGKLRSCPGPLVWPLPPPTMHPGPALVSSRDTGDREHRGDRKEGTQRQGNRKTKEERDLGENRDGGNTDKKP